LPSARDLVRAAQRGPVFVTGATAPYAAYLGAALAGDAPLVVVVADDDDARAWQGDLAAFGCAAAIVPAPDGAAYAELAADRAAEAARLATLYALATGGPSAPRVVVITGAALVRRTVPVDELRGRAVAIRKGVALPRDATAARLLDLGFARAQIVEDAGTFAVRGNVIDLGSPDTAMPVRIELDGDDVESIRLFDPATQRTLREIDGVDVHALRAAVPSTGHDWRAAIRDLADAHDHPSSATRKLIEQLATGDAIGADVYAPAFHAALDPVAAYLPADARWLWWDPDATLAAIDRELANAAAGYAERRAHKQLAFPPGAHYVERAEVIAMLTAAPRRVVLPSLAIVDDPRAAGAGRLEVHVDPLAALRTELERARLQHDDHLAQPLLRAIAALRADGVAVALAADSATRADRLVGLLEGHGLAADRTATLTANPMDRLVCGDVGFGKTEVALRAPSRRLEGGAGRRALPDHRARAAALLTFSERACATPCGSRCSRASVDQGRADSARSGSLKRRGKVDVVIGTHRLLSKDVHFKTSACWSSTRSSASASPTRSASSSSSPASTCSRCRRRRSRAPCRWRVSGCARSVVIATPPVDRRAVRTVVSRSATRSLREAMSASSRAAARSSTSTTASRGSTSGRDASSALVPEARVAGGPRADGPRRRSSATMLDFVEGRYDVLCATAIIESGLDIPRANTMIIDRADLFGLSQLYQLRGRVGRARERAYCYLWCRRPSQMSRRGALAHRGAREVHRAGLGLPRRLARPRAARRRRPPRRRAGSSCRAAAWRSPSARRPQSTCGACPSRGGSSAMAASTRRGPATTPRRRPRPRGATCDVSARVLRTIEKVSRERHLCVLAG
jgi:transcription-repair coupling factor (superfamily II helicase)